jgi:aspartokinase
VRLVIKFGGTSVGSAEAIGRAASLARDLRDQGHELIVVTSAMSGITDLLLGAAQAAAAGRLGEFLNVASSVRAKHLETCHTLFPDPAAHEEVAGPLGERLTEFTRLAEALVGLG